MADFKTSYKKTAVIEGGYANDPDDNGGETYKGIARKFWPAWKGWAIIDAIKKRSGKTSVIIDREAAKSTDLEALVLAFYKSSFWDVMGLDGLKNQATADELYDTSVNMGYKVAAKFMQRVLNALNKSQLLFPDLIVDGNMGAKTVAAFNSLSLSDQNIVTKFLNHLQGARYIDIVEADHSQEKFMRSWASRT